MYVRRVLVVECCHEFASIATCLVALPDKSKFTCVPCVESVVQHPFEAQSVLIPL